MMTLTFCGNTAFRDYLQSSRNDMFVLDLSNCTMVECIEKMCEVKQRSHPKIGRSYMLLIMKIKDIEQQFDCTIMPAMVSSRCAHRQSSLLTPKPMLMVFRSCAVPLKARTLGTSIYALRHLTAFFTFFLAIIA
jgi:hypothetical protein